MNKHTLYITFDGLSDPLGQSQILPYLAGLAANGYHITIISCEKEQRLKSQEKHIREKIAGRSIAWKYLLYDESGGKFSRWRYTARLRAMAEDSRKENPPLLVHCRSYLAALIGLSFKNKYGTPFIFDMRGFWADERLDGGIWNKKNPVHLLLYYYFKYKERSFIHEADAIISLTKNGLGEMERLNPGAGLAKKTTIIPCCTNLDLFKPIPPDLHLEGSGPGDHILVYTGSIGTWYFTKEMIDCVLEWQKEIPQIRLLVLTRDQEELKSILTGYTPLQQKIVISESVDYAVVPRYLSLAKAAIFFIKPAYSKIASSPTKMAECWAMDLPIITNATIGDNDLYFKNNAGGVLVKSFDAAAYRESCRTYLSLQPGKGRYRQLAQTHFNLQTAIAKYTSVYKEIEGAG